MTTTYLAGGLSQISRYRPPYKREQLLFLTMHGMGWRCC